MEKLKTILLPAIPLPAKVFGWSLVLAGLFFAYVYMASPGVAFPGVTISTYSEHFGLYSAGVRILGAVLGLFIALRLDSAALLALMLVTRVFTELGDVAVGLVINNGRPDLNTVTLLALAAVEAYFLTRLVKVVCGRG